MLRDELFWALTGKGGTMQKRGRPQTREARQLAGLQVLVVCNLVFTVAVFLAAVGYFALTEYRLQKAWQTVKEAVSHFEPGELQQP